MLKKKWLFAVLFFVLVLLAGASRVDADIAPPPEPIEPIKNAIDCTSIKISDKLSDYFFVVEMYTKRDPYGGLGSRSSGYYYEPLVPGRCYSNSDQLGINDVGVALIKDLPVDLEQARRENNLVEINSLIKGNYQDRGLDRYNNESDRKVLSIGRIHGPGGSLADNSYFIVKKDNPAKHIALNFEIANVRLDEHESYSVDFVGSAVVEFKDGSVKNMTLDEFDKFVSDYKPTYRESKGSNINYWAEYERPSVFSRILVSPITLFFFTLFIEGIIFFFFGSRRLKNYLVLFLANVVSYPTALVLMAVLPDVYSKLYYGSSGLLLSLGLYLNTSDERYFVWALAEVAVVIIEFLIFWLFLGRRYRLKEIALFVVTANAVTAGLALILDAFFRGVWTLY